MGSEEVSVRTEEVRLLRGTQSLNSECDVSETGSQKTDGQADKPYSETGRQTVSL